MCVEIAFSMSFATASHTARDLAEHGLFRVDIRRMAELLFQGVDLVFVATLLRTNRRDRVQSFWIARLQHEQALVNFFCSTRFAELLRVQFREAAIGLDLGVHIVDFFERVFVDRGELFVAVGLARELLHRVRRIRRGIFPEHATRRDEREIFLPELAIVNVANFAEQLFAPFTLILRDEAFRQSRNQAALPAARIAENSVCALDRTRLCLRD